MASNPFVLVRLDKLSLIRHPSWIAAVLHFVQQVQFFIFFLKSAILYGRQVTLSKYNLTFYNVAAIF